MMGLEETEDEEQFASRRRAATQHEFSSEEGRGESLAETRPRRGSLDSDSGYSRISAEDYINAALEEVECPYESDSDIESEYDDGQASVSSAEASYTSSSDSISLQHDDSSESECEDRFQNTVVSSSLRGYQQNEEDEEEDSFVGLEDGSMPSLSSFNQDSAADLFAEDSVVLGSNSSMPSLRSCISHSQHDSLMSFLSDDSLQEGEDGKFSMQENTRLSMSSVIVAEHDPSMPNLEELQLEEDSLSTRDSENRGFINKKD
jgi:hypothetical protein